MSLKSPVCDGADHPTACHHHTVPSPRNRQQHPEAPRAAGLSTLPCFAPVTLCAESSAHRNSRLGHLDSTTPRLPPCVFPYLPRHASWGQYTVVQSRLDKSQQLPLTCAIQRWSMPHHRTLSVLSTYTRQHKIKHTSSACHKSPQGDPEAQHLRQPRKLQSCGEHLHVLDLHLSKPGHH